MASTPQPGRFWKLVLFGTLLSSLACTGMLALQRRERSDATRATTAAVSPRDQEIRELSAERERLRRTWAEQQIELVRLRGEVERAMSPSSRGNTTIEDQVRQLQTLQAELLASQDRLEKAYRDIADMEKQIIEVSRRANELKEQSRREPRIPDPRRKVEGTIISVSQKVNLVLLSAGANDDVIVGDVFLVYRDGAYVSTLVVDRVEDQWSACRELTDLRESKIQQGDSAQREKAD